MHVPLAAVAPVATAVPIVQELKVVDEGKDKWRVEAAQWTEHTAEEGTYYYNTASGESTWECPPAVAFQQEITRSGFAMETIDGTTWKRVYAADGDFYYHNPETQESAWTLPPEVEALFRAKQPPQSHEEEEIREEKEKEKPVGEPNEEGKEQEVSPEAAPLVQARSEMELESSEDHLAKARIALAEKSLDAVKRKLGDMEGGSAAVDDDAQKRPKVDSAAADEPTNEAATGEEREGDEGGHGDDAPNEEQQQQIEQFKDMLREKKLTPFSKWDKELPRLCVDPRFKVLPRHGDRRAVFEAYVKNILNEERAAKRARAQAAKEGFERLLEEVRATLTADTKWSDFERTVEADPRFKAMGETSADRKERRALFDAAVAPLRQAKEKGAQEAHRAFWELLEETPDIVPDSRWSKVKRLLEGDPRYGAVGSSHEREELFGEYLGSISDAVRKRQRMASAEERLKEREREVRRRREKEEREMDEQRSKVRLEEAVAHFEALLSERVKHHDASWRESKPALSGDRRYSSPLLTSEQKEALFRKHLQKLMTDRLVQFKGLLAETEKIHMASSWEDARELIQDDPRWSRVPDDSERKKLFLEHVRELHERATQDFLMLLDETNKETMAISATTTVADWPKIEHLVRGDKRYRTFSVRPEERVRLLEAYIAGDRPKTAEDKRVASA